MTREQAHDYVFGYSIMQDISDRGSERLRGRDDVPGHELVRWQEHRPRRAVRPGDRAEGVHAQGSGRTCKITTRLNGKVVQDATTDEFIWDEAHMVGYLSSRMTLYPGDVIMTGTPAGTGWNVRRS